MRARAPFLISLLLLFSAMAVILAARSQFAWAIRQDLDEKLLAQYSQRGTWLLYSSWILAVGGTESLLCCSKRERGSSWPVVVLLGVFLYLNFAA